MKLSCVVIVAIVVDVAMMLWCWWWWCYRCSLCWFNLARGPNNARTFPSLLLTTQEVPVGSADQRFVEIYDPCLRSWKSQYLFCCLVGQLFSKMFCFFQRCSALNLELKDLCRPRMNAMPHPAWCCDLMILGSTGVRHLGELSWPHCSPSLGTMVDKGNHPQMALIQISEIL